MQDILKVADPAEQRRAKRRPATGRVIVIYGPDHKTVGAVLLDASTGGTLVQLDEPVLLSDTIYLIDTASRSLYQCAAAHQHPQTYGLRFLNKHPLAQLPTELRYLSRLWTDKGGAAFRKH